MVKPIFRWLGVNGLEIQIDGQLLLIDPFFTRPGYFQVITNQRVHADINKIKRHISRADAILITHAHYDHLLDVGAIAQITGAPIYGTSNVMRILQASGVPAPQLKLIASGAQFSLGSLSVTAAHAWHTATPVDFLVNRPLSAALRVPLRITDYRMDDNLGYSIKTIDRHILFGNMPVNACDYDLFFSAPYCPIPQLSEILQSARPAKVVLMHWENFFRPLEAPPRALPFRSRAIAATLAAIRHSLPQAEILIPELFHAYPF